MAHPIARFVAAVNREYERRVRRASQPPEELPHDDADGEEWSADEGAIANVPRGTVVRKSEANNG